MQTADTLVHVASCGTDTLFKGFQVKWLTTFRVPHFPEEDSKLRAEKVIRRRGGNTANTLQVLSDLVAHSSYVTQAMPRPNLSLISMLPKQGSLDALFIENSLPNVELACLHGETPLAPSSTIIQSKENNTRTIISYANNLSEMSTDDFFGLVNEMWFKDPKVWTHFEGRNPDITRDCIVGLRQQNRAEKLIVSIECEKPERTVIAEAARYADVVFFSRLWAEVHPLATIVSMHQLIFSRSVTCLVLYPWYTY